jgi:DNA polymerase III alpha subunit
LFKEYDHPTIDKIWTQIESFANYAFSKGHSASYAVESFQALYLKAYYPLEYMVATLNNGGGFYRGEFYVHEARMHGGIITPPCINQGDYMDSIHGTIIFLGLHRVAELEQKMAQQIIKERQTNGPYLSMANLVQRVSISLEQLRILIRIGALRVFNSSKKKLLWEAHLLIQTTGKSKYGNQLFALEETKFVIPSLQEHWIDDAYDEIEYLGFALCSPFDLVKGGIHNHLRARDLPRFLGQTIEIIGYLCTIKPTSTSRKERMCFGTFIDIGGDWLDTVHFPPSLAKFPLRGPGCYRIIGKVVSEFDFLSLEVSEIHRLPTITRQDVVLNC